MPTRSHARRPQGWNALLRKSHAHTPARSAERRARKASLDDEIDAYLYERDEDGIEDADDSPEDNAARPGRRPPTARNGRRPGWKPTLRPIDGPTFGRTLRSTFGWQFGPSLQGP